MTEAELEDRIREALKQGFSHRQTAKAFSVSLRTVQRALDPERRRRYDTAEYRHARDPFYVEKRRGWAAERVRRILALAKQREGKN